MQGYEDSNPLQIHWKQINKKITKHLINDFPVHDRVLAIFYQSLGILGILLKKSEMDIEGVVRIKLSP